MKRNTYLLSIFALVVSGSSPNAPTEGWESGYNSEQACWEYDASTETWTNHMTSDGSANPVDVVYEEAEDNEDYTWLVQFTIAANTGSYAFCY